MLLASTVTAAGKLAPAAIFAIAGVRFGLLGVYHLGAPGGWRDASGLVGLVLAAGAGYAMWSLALEDARGRTVLPTGRRARGAEALNSDLDAQVGAVEHEAGVRNQL